MKGTTDYEAAFSEINDNVKLFNTIVQQMADLYERKNADYGDSFSMSCTKYGPIAALTRMSDKFNRLESLILKKGEQKVEDEKIEDTLIDLANYAIMTVMWLKNSNPVDEELWDKLHEVYNDLNTEQTLDNSQV